ncbi:site-specific integrase [Sporosarcina sp. ANT_H38]|uniref:site-specific integrase n=1 Tax=Sporosarcina sp. ANT_H38 TaxID=2597358 RepID=UPI0011F2D716|nr:tyrosine-type recombinase/integrase [Sporosarcina sp. ANT_H38]KAA0941635.1 site-specific integrase [Sporosarcina sp. ANT_H38]
MAYIRKRNGKWSFTVNARDPISGDRKQITRSTFSSKKQAQLAASQMEKDIADGNLINESRITFGDFINDWLLHYEKQAKVSSVRARRIAAKHLIEVWNNRRMSSITRKMYQDRLDELSAKYSPNYLDSIHSTGNMIFNYAHSLELIKSNPTHHFKMPKKKMEVADIEAESIEEVFLEKEELSHFLKVTAEKGLESDMLIFTTLAYTGLRIGELVALKWSDIDMNKKSLRVTKTYYNPKNNKKEYTLLSPKTKGSIRTIIIDDLIISLLKKHKVKQNEHILKNRVIYKDENFIFAGAEGFPMVIKLVTTRLQRLLSKTDITKHFTLHGFRHTHTSLLIEAGVGVKEIQQRLGHTDINTTMNIYAHMTKNMEEKASQQFSKLMKDLL